MSAVALLLVLVLHGQSLGDAAKREEERRQGMQGKKAPTFTDSDLPSSGATADEPAPAVSPSPAPSDPAEVSPSGLPDDDGDRRRMEREWRARFSEARANLRAAESRAFEDKVGVAWKAGIPYQTIIREPVETEELRGARRELQRLEEEFRRTGLPPGWSRD